MLCPVRVSPPPSPTTVFPIQSPHPSLIMRPQGQQAGCYDQPSKKRRAADSKARRDKKKEESVDGERLLFGGLTDADSMSVEGHALGDEWKEGDKGKHVCPRCSRPW